MTREEAEGATQLRAVVGSTLHGLNLEGADDRDEMGVCLEPFRFAAGLGSFEQFIYRTAAEREGKHDAPSQPGDLDLTIYSLRKYVRLAMKGNPTILLLLFVPPDFCTVRTAIGQRLQALAQSIISRKAGRAFLGYMTAQRQRLTGERGGMDVNRRELKEKYGYDCYSDDTEFLTRRGWKLYDEIADGEAVATVDPVSRAVAFQVPSERVAKPYDGELLALRQRYSSALVTPNHRMWVSAVQRGPSGKYGDAYAAERALWRFVRCEELASGDRVHVQVSGAPRAEEYAVGDDLLRLVGAYVSEGCVARRLKSGQPSVVSMTQKVGGRLEAVLDASGLPFKRYEYVRNESWRSQPCTAATYTLADRTRAGMLSDECGEGARHKHLPQWAFDLSRRQADILLDALIAGDGTKYPRTPHRIYYTASRKLAGDVQALALTAGYRSNVWGPFAPTGMYQVLVAEGAAYQAIGCKTHLQRRDPVPTRIVCFTVPNETLVTRREGRVAMHGNTKYAMHMLRLGFQGIELLETGGIVLPVDPAVRRVLMDVRQGRSSLQDVLTLAGELERNLEDLLDASPLPADPDYKAVEQFLMDTYGGWWSAEWHAGIKQMFAGRA